MLTPVAPFGFADNSGAGKACSCLPEAAEVPTALSVEQEDNQASDTITLSWNGPSYTDGSCHPSSTDTYEVKFEVDGTFETVSGLCGTGTVTEETCGTEAFSLQDMLDTTNWAKDDADVCF